MSDSHKKKSLPLRTKACYGIGDLAGSLIATVTGFFFNVFLLDVARLDPGYIGVIILLSRVFDAINDPVIGILSDKTSTRWGRRRPWLLFGAPLLGISFAMFWFVPFEESQQGLLFAYYLGAGIFESIAFTAVNLPYCALTPEIAVTYDQRTELTMFRFLFSLLGSCISAIGQAALNRKFSTVTGLMIGGVLWGSVAFVATWITFFGTRERGVNKPKATSTMSVYKEFGGLFKNHDFMLVTGIYALAWISLQLVQNNLVLYAEYVMHAKDKVELIFVGLMAMVFICLVTFNKISEKRGKKFTYYIGASLWACSQMALAFLEPGNDALLYVLGALAGVGVAVIALVPWSMLPDVIDLDELNTGVRREGVFYSSFVFFQKLGISIALAASNFALKLAGYISPPSADVSIEQPHRVLLVLRTFMGPIPAILLALSFFFMYKYSITKDVHNDIIHKLSMKEVQLDPENDNVEMLASEPIMDAIHEEDEDNDD